MDSNTNERDYTAFANVDPVVINTINLNEFIHTVDQNKRTAKVEEIKFPDLLTTNKET